MSEHSDRQRRLMDDLSTEARVLKQARMLPATGTLTPEHLAEVRKSYGAYTYKHTITDAHVAKQINYATSVVSQWRSGGYKGDVDAVTRAINHWLERDARARDKRLELPYVPTRVCEDMKLVTQLALERGCMAVLVVPSGAGKTMVMETLTGQMRGVYLYCDEDLSPKEFLRALGEAAGVNKVKAATMADYKRLAIAKLRGSRRPIFLDEAHRLRSNVFPRVRSLYDQTGCPIIMAGTHEILQHVDDQANGRGQMTSRCLRYNALDYCLNVEDPRGGQKLGRPLYSRQEIAAVIEHLGVRLSDDALTLAWAYACLSGHGCLRTVRLAMDTLRAKWPGQTIERDQVVSILGLMFGGKGSEVAGLASRLIDAASSAEVAA